MKKADQLKALSYIYIFSPVIIFLLGWTKLYLVGLPLAISVLFCLIRMFRRTQKEFRINIVFAKKDWIKVVVILAIIGLWVYISGVGGYVWQNTDHRWRNELFDILVSYKWPVVKGTVAGSKGISYYIGFWMIPAVIGKLYGLAAGYFAQYIWAVIGIALAYAFMCRRENKVLIWPLVLFIFISGLDIVGMLLFDFKSFTHLELGTHIERWIKGYQFSSFTTQLFWVFNQAIYGWLITLLIMEEKNHDMVILMAAGIFLAPLPMVGLFPMTLCVIWNNVQKLRSEKNIGFIRGLFTSLITYENIIGVFLTIVFGALFLSNNALGFSFGTITSENALKFIVILAILVVCSVAVLAYLKRFKHNSLRIKERIINNRVISNIYNNKLVRIVFKVGMCVLLAMVLFYGSNHSIPANNELTSGNNVYRYLLFLLIEIGAYVIFTYKSSRKNNIYICALIMLLFCPMVVIGAGTDFCMRACIPAQVVLFMAFVDVLKEFNFKQKRATAIIMAIVILLGSVTTINEFLRTIINYPEYKEYGRIEANKEQIFESLNFNTDVENNLFYKYMANY
ncbi:MAG: hypothetical protein K5769_04995 [Pseudobutyrivibrio sp.]|nr:hypothetical protein [Pseudobutyrivibrio sp.]